MRRIARKPSYRRRYTGTKAAVHTAKSTKSSAWRLKLRCLVYGVYRQVNYQAASLQIKLQRLLRHKHFRKYTVGAAASLTFLLVIVQLAYPSDKTLPFAHVDGLAIGSMAKDAAASV